MDKNVLIVEDQFIEANDLKIMLEKSGYKVCGIARSVDKALSLVESEKPSLVLVDIFLKGNLTGIDLAQKLKQAGIAFIFISANSNTEILEAAKATQPYGFLVKPFRERDLLVMLDIAQYRHENSIEASLRKEAKLQNVLKQTADSQIDLRDKMVAVCKSLQEHIPFDYIVAGEWEEEPAPDTVSLLRVGFDEYQFIGAEELKTITKQDIRQLAKLHKIKETLLDPAIYNNVDLAKYRAANNAVKLYSDTFRLESLLDMPVRLTNGSVLLFSFYSRRPGTYDAELLLPAKRISQSLASVLDSIYNISQNESLLQGTKPTNAITPAASKEFEGIVGNSHHLLTVFDHIAQVAPVDTSVLILGESGTGKERIVDVIHQLSPRKNKPLIKINCAALPSSLIESELFGHEKGAFTGAQSQRIGKFEMAHKGTIFLDEIGELPLELQAKLLRVLQEKEIERVGGNQPVKTDVRIIAATNRNLETEVGEGRFRLDLYYRLNVFPLEIPALRQRKEDIPALVQHFIGIYSKKANKKIDGVTDEVLQQMMAYTWPGNIRELENIIERGVLLAKDNLIKEVSLPRINHSEIAPEINSYSSPASIKNIQDNERDHIIAVLKFCNGRIWGETGAAALLNLPPTTLNSRMKKLGIKREFL
ncbi:Fis family transcriptional regulator [Flavobacterium rivuli WB 3.3-2 = DSM 21788]|uniref:Fis family transcriptional regulator n=1 Tax=Flavobacterium rivuli WB 3.3-2 = DSM 21788 TaxID=1121895 RepID=A0A0A2MEG8_9FLAO|nr:sigma 54-interacting transcriptional regulator [Flavobacterium rivuli]KGO86660.1 Fis family transcriptional regulator [Flavobacterium rivuli WB 3.3-2 = DSM 21788]